MLLLSAVFAVQIPCLASASEPPAAAAKLNEASRAPAARAPAATASNDTSDDEYNFSWLDPDKKVYVLQNRKYRKAGHAAVFLQGGLNLDNPYRSETLIGPRVSYWFSEQFGLDAFYYHISSKANDTYTTLENAATNSGALPFVREHKAYMGLLGSWTPWYAKLNFFNKILYFDWFLNLGAGQTNSRVDRNRSKATPANFVDENPFTIFYGTGQNFYVTRNFLVRFDVIGSTYNATSINANTTKRYWNWDFTLGVGYLF